MPEQRQRAPATAGASREAGRRRINFNVRVRIDRPAEWAEMFDDGWRTMKYRFYDPKMHGMDWDAMRAKYRPLVDFVGDRQELLNILNEMIGELNASHTGAAPPPRGPGAWRCRHVHLGIELEPDKAAGRYRVTHVYEDGPADKDWVRVKAGDYLLAIDGKPVKAGDEYWAALEQPAQPQGDRDVQLANRLKMARGTSRIEAITTALTASCATSVGSRNDARKSMNFQAGASATCISRR